MVGMNSKRGRDNNMASAIAIVVAQPNAAPKEQELGRSKRRRNRRPSFLSYRRQQWKSVCYCFNIVLLLRYHLYSATFVHGFARHSSSHPNLSGRRSSVSSSKTASSSTTVCNTSTFKYPMCPMRAHRKVRRRTYCSPFNNPPQSNTSLLKATPTGGGEEGDEGERMLQRATKKNVRLQVFQTLSSPIVEVVGFALVLLSSLLVALDTLQNLPLLAYLTIDRLLLVINLVFALDFFVRWYAAGQFKAIYLTKPLVALDIVVVLVPLLLGSAMLPLLDYLSSVTNYTSSSEQAAVVAFLAGLQNSAGLQNLLLLRVLRLRRILTDNVTFGKFAVVLGLKPQDIRPYQLQLARVLLSIFTLLSVSSGLIYTAEHQVNPAIPDYFSALYFGLTTLTTVGLGDITPVTPQGRLVVCGSILFGVAIIPVQTAKLVDIFVESQKDQQLRKKPKPKRKAVTTSTSVGSMLSATNGLGPSGVAIEIPVEDRAPPEEGGGGGGRACGNCMASPHREDAIFCWSCGSPLPVVVTAYRRSTNEDDDGSSLR